MLPADAVILALKLYWDPTTLTKIGDRTCCPIDIWNLALPLEELRKPSHCCLLSYITSLPKKLLLGLSEDRKRSLRKICFRAQIQTIFSEVDMNGIASIGGIDATGADGVDAYVYPRFAGLSLDYPKVLCPSTWLSLPNHFTCRPTCSLNADCRSVWYAAKRDVLDLSCQEG